MWYGTMSGVSTVPHAQCTEAGHNVHESVQQESYLSFRTTILDNVRQ